MQARITEHIAATQNLLRGDVPHQAAAVAEMAIDTLRCGGKLLLFGNGGSAADATHLAAEFVGRFRVDRPALPALSLTDNASTTSAVGNDFGFDEVFARQIAAFGQPGDLAIGLTTSGRSLNVIRGLHAARQRDMRTIVFCGLPNATLDRVTDLCVCAPARETARIQECHMLVGHIVCELVERAMFPPEAT
ncbi:D-sedoheptulose-7-phosphate isomerase [Solirubrobacter deserti]|uniref:SIS domain-containing protein n=1 Tax=Solirubrobacter deserti TaxID=2282478 RepID=A0ABT4RMW1_9ACTN|nr:SIS domain-containing protein [Solirubrobacter deserti]MDA0139641.1 SIS domain-containing protein [Solirubrobacter deserti]